MIIKTMLKAIKPFRLVSLFLMYGLGGGLVQYVRNMHSWSVFFQGLIFILLIVLSCEYLCLLNALREKNKWPEGVGHKEIKQIRWLITLVTATLLTAATTILVDWMIRGVLRLDITFLVISLITASSLYYLIHVADSLKGYQILVEMFLFVVIPPAFAYLLQSDDIHRFLTLVVVSLTPAYLAFRILVQLKLFHHDQKYEIFTPVTRMGWQKAMVLHNVLILLAYFLFALIMLFGVPWFLLWPVFLTFPIALLEVGLMERVKRGKKPLWRVMQIATACVFFFSIYLVGFAFWIR